MTILSNLTKLYRAFYRADKRYNPSTRSVIKPMIVARNAILHCRFDFEEELVQVLEGSIHKMLDNTTAEGYSIIKDFQERKEAVQLFASYYVKHIFFDYLNTDRANLCSESWIGIVEDTVEFLYRIEQDKENQEMKTSKESETNDLQFNDLRFIELFHTTIYTYSIIPDELEEGKILITMPEYIELVIRDFHTSKALESSLLGNDTRKDTSTDEEEELIVKSVTYPLDEYPTDTSTMSLEELSKIPNTFLQVISVTGKSEDITREQCTLWIGNSFSMKVPYHFAISLQHFLTTGELVE